MLTKQLFFFLWMILIYPAVISAQVLCSEREIRTEIIIRTSSEAAWNLLTDFEKYPEWHPYIQKVEGEPVLKHKLKITVYNEDSTTSRFSAYILEFRPNETLSWGGSLGFIFRAKHYFIIRKIDADTIQLIQGEYWKGLFGKSYGRKIYRDTFNKFNLMNSRMKTLLEQSNKPQNPD